MGIGSKLKKLARKAIPKEVSKAAPIVGVFNPALGAALGAAGGIREGDIGKAALQGLGAFGIGKVAQGIGAIFDKAEALGGQLGNVLGTRTTAQSVGAPSADIFAQTTKKGIGQQIKDVLNLDLDDDLKNNLINNILAGDTPGTGAGGITRGQILKGLLGFGVGFLGDKQAQDEYEDRMARAGFNQTLQELQAQYQDPRVFESTPISYEDGGEVRDPEYEGWKKMYEKNQDIGMMHPKASEYLKIYQKEQEQLNEKANGGIIGFANGGEPAMEMDYRGGGFIPVGAKERADDVPARLSKNEFVMTADAVRAAGGGNVNKGAKRMYSLMNALEAKA